MTGQELITWMRVYGMSNIALAEVLEMTEQQITNWRVNRSPIDRRTELALGQIELGLTVPEARRDEARAFFLEKPIDELRARADWWPASGYPLDNLWPLATDRSCRSPLGAVPAGFVSICQVKLLEWKSNDPIIWEFCHGVAELLRDHAVIEEYAPLAREMVGALELVYRDGSIAKGTEVLGSRRVDDAIAEVREEIARKRGLGCEWLCRTEQALLAMNGTQGDFVIHAARALAIGCSSEASRYALEARFEDFILRKFKAEVMALRKEIEALAIECADAAFDAASEDDQREIASWYGPMGGDLLALRELVEEHGQEEYTDEQLSFFGEAITERLEELGR